MYSESHSWVMMPLLLSLAVATAAANDPPRPVFPGAFSVRWNLTKGAHDPLTTVSSGATELDDSGSGKQRDTMLFLRKSDLYPGKTFHMTVETISDWAAGDSWTHKCSNQTAVELCTCEYIAITGVIHYRRSPAATFAGTEVVGGVVLNRWQITPTIVWAVTAGSQPNLLVTAREDFDAPTGPDSIAEQVFGKYTIGPPAPSRWVVPLVWNCSKQ